jgi:hypothetical protein
MEFYKRCYGYKAETIAAFIANVFSLPLLNDNTQLLVH